MLETFIKIKRKFIETLISHWYPGFLNFYTIKNQTKRNRIVTNLPTLFINICTKLIWIIAKPILKFISILNCFFIFYKKKKPSSGAFFYKTNKFSPKIIAIGNIIVGGAGKTPSTICLINEFVAQGFKPGVISRGYKSTIDKKNKQSALVKLKLSSFSSVEYGDEPCLIAETGVPVFVGNRLESYKILTREFPQINVVFLDDGLQQTQIKYDKNILVIDKRLTGNGKLLPYGPLREKFPPEYNIDGIIINSIGDDMNNCKMLDRFSIFADKPIGHLKSDSVLWKNTKNEEFETDIVLKKIQENYLKTKTKPLAVAGIAVPSRFFKTLEKLKIEFEPLWFENHDINFTHNLSLHLKSSRRIVLMTEKDGMRILYSEKKLNMDTDLLWILKLNLSIESTFVKTVTNWVK